jgi:hypothetical protein
MNDNSNFTVFMGATLTPSVERNWAPARHESGHVDVLYTSESLLRDDNHVRMPVNELWQLSLAQ